MLIVLYAKDIERLAVFYETALRLPRMDQDADFVLLGAGAVELAVVRASKAMSKAIQITSPPRLRAETPMKPSFPVSAIEALRAGIDSAGGGLKPIGAAWTWRGDLHLDGWDPEGNVFQLRQEGGLKA